MEFPGLPSKWREWKIVELLGNGAYGDVYKARRMKDEQEEFCAIKIMKVPGTQSDLEELYLQMNSRDSLKKYLESIIEDYSKEIDVMYSLHNHPNIVQIMDHVMQEVGVGWVIFIQMELLDPLNRTLSRNLRQMGEEEVIRVGIDICKALQSCHSRSIIHRDIKPENIFVDGQGNYKLGDFGTARTISKTMGSMSTKGTYSYMAPEVYLGGKYDARADIYSLGITMYRLLNRNRDPFVDPLKQIVTYGERSAALKRRMDGEPLPPAIDASKKMQQLLTKACAFRPEDRFTDAEQFLHVLTLLQSGSYPLSRRGPFSMHVIIPLMLGAGCVIVCILFGWRMLKNRFVSRESDRTALLQTETMSESALPQNSSEPMDGLAESEPTGQTEKQTEQTNQTESAEQTEQTNQTEPAEQTEQTNQTEPAEQTEQSTEPTEQQTEPTNQSEKPSEEQTQQSETGTEETSAAVVIPMSPLEMISAMGLSYIGNTQYPVTYTASDGLAIIDRDIPTGVITYELTDYDGDGELELMMLLLKPSEKQGRGGTQSAKLSVMMFENEDGKWVWADSVDIPDAKNYSGNISLISELLPHIRIYSIEDPEEPRLVVYCDSQPLKDGYYNNLMSVSEIKYQDDRLAADTYDYNNSKGLFGKISEFNETVQGENSQLLASITIPELFSDDGFSNGTADHSSNEFPMDVTLQYTDYSNHGVDSPDDGDPEVLSLLKDFYDRYIEQEGLVVFGESYQTDGVLPYEKPALLAAYLYKSGEGNSPELILIRTELSDRKTEIGMVVQECNLSVEEYYVQNGAVSQRGRILLEDDLCWNGKQLEAGGWRYECNGISSLMIRVRYQKSDDENTYYFIRPGEDFAVIDQYMRMDNYIESPDSFDGTYTEWTQMLRQKYGAENLADFEQGENMLFHGMKTGSEITTDYTQSPEYHLELQCLNEMTDLETSN